MPEIDYFGPMRRKTADLQKMTPEARQAYKRAIARNSTRNYQNRKREKKREKIDNFRDLNLKFMRIQVENRTMEVENSGKIDKNLLENLKNEIRRRAVEGNLEKYRRLDENVKNLELKLQKIMDVRHKEKTNTSTNASQKCRTNEDLRMAVLELQIFMTQNRLEMELEIREELQKLLENSEGKSEKLVISEEKKPEKSELLMPKMDSDELEALLSLTMLGNSAENPSTSSGISSGNSSGNIDFSQFMDF
ncbi:hypothetical protein L3Y34_000349 [Caenorhabditis briggsae]|uniref:Uncharacterized protein n=1 Tax=Caenorhabditis briggsae TaxID=6238 RepID=A0AAE9IMH8_CAEBR|nr:hypothetical protein L3Y34_000349 [Caenorhabditis briggsae]